MTTHGGRRPGSGRKPKLSCKTSLTVQLPDELYAAMEAAKDRLRCSWPVLVQHMAVKAGIVPTEDK